MSKFTKLLALSPLVQSVAAVWLGIYNLLEHLYSYVETNTINRRREHRYGLPQVPQCGVFLRYELLLTSIPNHSRLRFRLPFN
jgi:hypothetical protein